MKRWFLLTGYSSLLLVFAGPVVFHYWDPLDILSIHSAGELCEFFFFCFAMEAASAFMAAVVLRGLKHRTDIQPEKALSRMRVVSRVAFWAGLVLAMVFAAGSGFCFMVSMAMSS